MRNGMKTLLLLVLLLHYTSSSAVQIESFRDHHTLKFIISAQELTHIVVKGDRIQTVRGNEGTYAINLNDSDGTVFIKPTTEYQTQPFSVFISTAQGRTIPLFLTPRQLPSDTLIIQPERAVSVQTGINEKAESYASLLLTLIQAMAQRKDYEGFTVFSEKPVTLLKNPTLHIERVTHYTGTPFHGEVLHISNRSTRVLTFPFESLIVSNTKAIAAESLTLLPGHSLCVYRVQRYEQ